MEILAIALPAMALLNANQRDFLVLEDLYPHEQVYQHTDKFARDVSNWLREVDKLCLLHLGVDRIFHLLDFGFCIGSRTFVTFTT